MTETQPRKRPASHRWAIGFLAFMTAGFVIFLIDVITGRSGASPGQYWMPIAVLSVGALALFSLVLGGRRQWAYYVTSGSLAIWTLRSIYTLLFRVYYLIVGEGPVSAPFFHLAQRDKAFVVQQQMPLTKQIMLAVSVALLAWLFVRFTFGRPSRSYYGFTTPKNPDPSS